MSNALRRWLAVQADLAEFFRQVAFNVAVGNRDDHQRNLDDSDNRPTLHTMLSTAAFYGLSTAQAGSVVQDVADVVANWPGTARDHGIARADISLMASAFQAAKF